MERPNSPSVPPSEPEAEKMLVESALDDIKNDRFDGVKIHLPYVREYLQELDLDIDDEGFIVTSETEEYAVPYTFVDELVEEYVKDEDESVFDAFFRPVTDERVYGWDNERLHLSDLHSVITTSDGSSHPVRDDAFDLAEFHVTLETGCRVVMGWSDLIKKENIDDSGRWLSIAKESDDTLELNCSSEKCGYSGELSSWDGDDNSPVCPDCGGAWDDDDVTICTICDSWYWGTYFEGESVYAEPVCANCGADMEHLEHVSRYHEDKTFEEISEQSRPGFAVVGVGENGSVVHVFEYTQTWDDAVDEKEFTEDIIGGNIFEEVESVAIQDRDELDSVTRYTRDDDQR